MNEHNERRTERIFDAIGGIDDKLIQDAMSPKKAREYIASRKRTKISIVAVACLFCLVIGAITRLPDLSRMANSALPSLGQDQAPQETEANNSEHRTPISLESTLNQSADSKMITHLSKDKLELLDSTPKLIWQFDGEEYYSVAKIKHTDSLNVITRELDSPSSNLTAEESEQINVRVWISYGNGRIISPYLKHTPGNTGMGALFDYSAEVEPSAEFTEAVLELIK